MPITTLLTPVCYTDHIMTDSIFDDFALEKLVKDKFGLTLEVDKIIANRVPVSHTAIASVFLTEKKQLFCYVDAKSSQALGDVKKIMTRMGLKPESYVPPVGHPEYFDDIARERFRSVFPGRTHVTSEDLVYYRTLAPYNPALIKIREIPDSVIKQFDTDAQGNWRPAARFTYRRIQTS